MTKGHLTFTVLFWLSKQREKNGKAPIYLRLTVDSKRIEICTHQKIDPHAWDQKAQKVKGKSEEAKIINTQLAIMQTDIHKHYGLLLAFDKPITAESIKNAYLGIGEKQKSLIEAFDFHNKRFEEKVKSGKKSPAS